jgi:pimeloyl-ACP methyl ester carboxylesterase
MTLPQMTADAEAIVAYLRHTYGKKKIFLLGHSWGTVLGLTLARRHPDWFYAYVGAGQVVNMRKSEADGYNFALAEARAHHNVAAERELLALAPYPGPTDSLTFDRIGRQRKWLNYYGGLTYGRTDFTYDDDARTLSPDYTDRDLASIDSGGLYSLTHLLPALASLDYDSVTAFKCPIFLFNGRYDYAVSHILSAEWFGRVKAPAKRLVWFDNSAHMMMQEEPGRFLYHLITDVRPIAVKAGDGAAAWAPAGAGPQHVPRRPGQKGRTLTAGAP